MTSPTPLPRTSLLATDGSPDSRLAARAAADLASRGGVALHLVHAWQPVTGFAGVTPVAAPVIDEDSAREVLAAEMAWLRARHVDVAGAHLRVGPPQLEILAEAEEVGAGLIVMGTRGLGAVRRAVLGSVSEHVVHHAQVPVLVMRGPNTVWPPHRVVVGDDATAQAEAVLPLAGEIAGLFGAQVTLVHALPHLADTLRERDALTANVVDDILEFAQGELEDHRDQLSDDVAARTRVRIAVGEPERALLDAAAEDGGHTLLVVGSRGLGMFGRLRLGSVSTAVLRHARGPVLVGAPQIAPALHELESAGVA